MNPSAAARQPLRGAAATSMADARTRRCLMAFTPSQTRYTAPISFTAVKTSSERCTRAPMPRATLIATVWTPATLPATDASAVRRP